MARSSHQHRFPFSRGFVPPADLAAGGLGRDSEAITGQRPLPLPPIRVQKEPQSIAELLDSMGYAAVRGVKK